MKRSEVDFSEEYKKQLENDLLSKHIEKFTRKFKIGICCVCTPKGQFDLLKQDFERLYPNLNFEEEWKRLLRNKDNEF